MVTGAQKRICILANGQSTNSKFFNIIMHKMLCSHHCAWHKDYSIDKRPGKLVLLWMHLFTLKYCVSVSPGLHRLFPLMFNIPLALTGLTLLTSHCVHLLNTGLGLITSTTSSLAVSVCWCCLEEYRPLQIVLSVEWKRRQSGGVLQRFLTHHFFSKTHKRSSYSLSEHGVCSVGRGWWIQWRENRGEERGGVGMEDSAWVSR